MNGEVKREEIIVKIINFIWRVRGMKVDLLPHNQEAYKKIGSEIADGKRKVAISHATGTGKSYLIAKLFEDHSDDKKLVLVPSTYIRDQIQRLFEKYDIKNADVVLYQKLIKMSDEDIATMDYSVIALDEYHHDTSKVWGTKVRTLIDTHPESIIFGTSATPIRSDGVNTIDELFEGNCANDLPLSESIAKKIVPLPKYVGALYTLDDELERLRKKVENATNSKEEKKEYYKKINTMRSQIEKSYGMPIILNKHIKNREGKYIVFCKNKTHLAEIKDTVIGWFRTAGFKDIHTYEVYSDYENKDADYNAFCNDTSHSSKLLFSIDVLNEGLHLENISGVLLLRPTRSSIVWHQQIGRAIEANNTNIPVIIDAVNNFSSVAHGIELLKEIKNAIVKEKENDPDFDDSGLEDIDTFFVLEQVMEIKEMFAQIEGRLEGSWDLYIKALKQYKEREGDCDVPTGHVEIVDDISVTLYNWVSNVRSSKNGYLSYSLTVDRIKQLDEMEFIWDSYKYRFERNIKDVAEYFKKFGEYPPRLSENLEVKHLAEFLCDEKRRMRNKNIIYPEWKIEILEKNLPDFSCETRTDKLYNEFFYYAKIYKEKHGHLNIAKNDIINGYAIGRNRSNLSHYNVLSEFQLNELEKLGVYLGDNNEKRFNNIVTIAKQAVEDGVIVSGKNRKYKEKNLYIWVFSTVKRKYKKNKLSIEEKKIIEKLMGKSLDDLYCSKDPIKIKVADVVENKEVGIFESQKGTARRMREKYNIKISNTAIRNRLAGKVTTPYKGRFMFYRVDENGEVTE